MQSVKLDQQTRRILPQVAMIMCQDSQQEGVFGGADSFDDETVVLGVVKEAATLSRRVNLRQDVFSCQ